MRKIKTIFILCLFLLHGLQILRAQHYGNSGSELSNELIYSLESPRILDNSSQLVEVYGVSHLTVENVILIFNMKQKASTLPELQNLSTERIQSFKEQLQRINIQAQNLYIDFISQVPVYEYEVEKKLFSKTYNEIPKSFELQQNIYVPCKFTQIQDVLYAAGQAELFDLAKVEYVFDLQAETSKLKEKAREELQKKALKAQGMIKKVDSLIFPYAENFSIEYPEQKYVSYKSYDSQNKTQIYSKNNYNEAKKTVSYVYQSSIPEKVDFVMGSDVWKPSIRLHFRCIMWLKSDKEKLYTPYYLLQPDGKFTLLQFPNHE